MSYGWEGNRRFDVAAVLPRVATTFSSHCSCANSNVNILNHIQLRSRDLARKEAGVPEALLACILKYFLSYFSEFCALFRRFPMQTM